MILHLVVLLIPHGKLELNSWLPVLVSAKSQPCKHLDCESENERYLLSLSLTAENIIVAIISKVVFL